MGVVVVVVLSVAAPVFVLILVSLLLLGLLQLLSVLLFSLGPFLLVRVLLLVISLMISPNAFALRMIHSFPVLAFPVRSRPVIARVIILSIPLPGFFSVTILLLAFPSQAVVPHLLLIRGWLV